VCLPVCLPACTNKLPTGQVFLTFNTGDIFLKICREKSKYFKMRQKYPALTKSL